MNEKQKKEALERMKLLRLMPEVIKDFKNENKLYYSERQNSFFCATLYWLDNKPEWVAKVKEFEKETNCLVYHCQLTHSTFGDMLSLLYVSGEEEEWEQERNDLSQNLVFAKVINLDDEWLSDFGYIGIKSVMGGIARTE